MLQNVVSGKPILFLLLFLHGRVFGWLNLLNAELSSKRYWMGPTSQEVEEEGDYT